MEDLKSVERAQRDWKKRPSRSRQSLTGVAYRSDGSWVRVHMVDLSYDGCRLLSADPLDVGETVTLVMPKSNHMIAQVRWAKDLEHGLRFVSGASVDQRRTRIGV